MYNFNTSVIIVNAVQTQEEDITDSALCKPTTRKKVRSFMIVLQENALQSVSPIEACCLKFCVQYASGGQ